MLRAIDFMGQRRLAVSASMSLILASLLTLGWQGLNLGLDFTGGVLVEIAFEREVPTEQVRTTLARAGYPEALVQRLDDREVLVRLLDRDQQQTADLAQTVAQILHREFAGVSLLRTEFVGPAVGRDMAESALLAMLAALIAMCTYLMWRFAGKFAVAAVIALAHDVIITLGAFAVFRWSVDLPVVAALLSVIGYSLNDTIVICDRIRENLRKERHADLVTVVNLSLNQTLERTLAMSGTTLLVLLAMLAGGGPSLQGFAMALTIGVVVGTYSSVYVAAAYLIAAGLKREDLLPPADDSGAGPPAGTRVNRHAGQSSGRTAKPLPPPPVPQ